MSEGEAAVQPLTVRCQFAPLSSRQEHALRLTRTQRARSGISSAIVDSAEGLRALREGNFRAALSSALNLAPFGGVVKEGLQYASVLFGKKLL